MSWRSVWSATGDGVPLDAQLGLTWGPWWTSAASGRCCCWPRAPCCMPGWAVVGPVHEVSWPGSLALCLLSDCRLAELPSRCVVDSYSILNELPLVQAKPNQNVNWGQRLAWSTSRHPCLLAIPAFDCIAGLSNRHLNSKRGLCLR
jgi:hypothetical protein